MAINDLIANPRTPDFMGAVSSGMQTRQALDLNQMRMGQMQNQQMQQNRLNQLLSQNAPTEQIAQISPDAAAKVQQLRSSMTAQQQAEFDRTITQAAALTQGVQDPNQYAQKIQASGLFDPEDTQALMQLGPEGVTRLAQLTRGGAQRRVQSSEQLPGGLVQVVYSDGTIETKAPDQAESEMIRDAEQRGVELQTQRSQGRGLGAESAKLATQAFTQSRAIKTNIMNLEDVVKTVGEGAETGPIAKRLPSFRAASIKLDNIRSRLGLDIIGSVTFGALSEGELALALDTALPTNLEGPELKKWAQDKITAQKKLADYLEKQATFLSKPGNTVGDWLDKLDAEQPEQQMSEDDQAMEWARNNPNDPRAQAIMQRLKR